MDSVNYFKLQFICTKISVFSSLEPKDSKQILSITKNFKVENIGPLPITVTSLKINGYNCQGYGFEVLDCHQFSLGPNASRDISIV